MRGLRKWLVLAPVALAAAGLAAPAFAADQTNSGGNGQAPAKTGVGPRGTTEGPSTQPGQAGGIASHNTGAGPRGTTEGPSTEPPAVNRTSKPAQ